MKAVVLDTLNPTPYPNPTTYPNPNPNPYPNPVRYQVELGVGFIVLGNILWDALDRCKEDNDVRSAKVIMMLSQVREKRYKSLKLLSDNGRLN